MEAWEVVFGVASWLLVAGFSIAAWRDYTPERIGRVERRK